MIMMPLFSEVVMKRLLMNEKDKRAAYLIAWASILQVAESFIPSVVPGVKLGLANMITIVALVDMGMSYAVMIALLRTVISSFIMGTFLSPTFLLSFSSAIASSVVMGLIYISMKGSGKYIISLIGLSIIGAAVHNGVQLSLVYLFLIKNNTILFLMPWLGISAVIMGFITGVVASSVCKKVEDGSAAEHIVHSKKVKSTFEIAHYNDTGSLIHKIPAVLKILFVFVIAGLILFFENRLAYVSIFAFLLILGAISKVPFKQLFAGVRRLKIFVFLSFVLPALFTGGKIIAAKLGPVMLYEEGVYTGILYASRIVILMLSASILVKSTSPDQLAHALKKLLGPFKFFGMSGERTAEIMLMSWNAIPVLWDRAAAFLQDYKKKGNFKFKNIVEGLSEMIAGLYAITEDEIVL